MWRYEEKEWNGDRARGEEGKIEKNEPKQQQQKNGNTLWASNKAFA